MSYNNFSDWYKKALVNAENNIKEIKFIYNRLYHKKV
jgi:hypothetical protein